MRRRQNERSGIRERLRSYATAGLVLLLAAAAGFGVPGLLFTWQDRGRLGHAEAEEAESVVISKQPELTIVEKVKFLSADTYHSLALTKGKNYTQGTIEKKVEEELAKLGERGLIPEQFSAAVSALSSEVEFMMDASGETSVMVWKGEAVFGEEGWLNYALEDETGKVISLQGYFYGDTLKKEIAEEAAEEPEDKAKRAEEYEKKCMEIAQGWGDYLGCSVATVNISGIYSEKADNDAEAYGIDPAVWEGMTKDKELNWYNISAVYRDEKGNEAGYLFDFNSDTGEYYVEPFY